ncbi:MAG: hypothetical protein AAB833_02510 [Patescibacteria group bacterium]
MPTRHHLSRKGQRERTAVARKEAAFTRRKNKAKRFAKAEITKTA